MSVRSTFPGSWVQPPVDLSLDENSVHVWRVELDQPEPILGALFSLLSSDEQGRAFRFHFDRDRRRFVVARGALRAILARYLQSDPAAIRFGYSEHGKPYLESVSPWNLEFNVSHSDDLALVAVAKDRRVGVDLEKLRPEFAGLEIAERFFSSSELQALRSLPLKLRPRGFFNCWTRKEAFVKATGKGLSYPLHAFDVTLAPGEAPQLLRVKGDDPGRWQLFDLFPGADFVGALVSEKPPVVLQTWQWIP